MEDKRKVSLIYDFVAVAPVVKRSQCGSKEGSLLAARVLCYWGREAPWPLAEMKQEGLREIC